MALVLSKRQRALAVGLPSQAAARVAWNIGQAIGRQVKQQLSRTPNVQNKTGTVRQRAARRRTRANRRQQRNKAPVNIFAPSALGTNLSGGMPIFNDRSSCIIRGHEALTALPANGSFSSDEYAMVPEEFKWLKTIAAGFSRYRWRMLRVEFITSSSTQDRGQVSLGATYDGLDYLAQDMAEMSQLAHSVTGPVWSNQTLVFDANRWSHQWYSYTNSLNLEPGETNEYVPAWLQFGRDVTNGGNIGSLHAYYEIEFIDPIPARMNSAVQPSIETGDTTVTENGFRRAYRKLKEEKPTTEDLLLEAFRSLLALRSGSEEAEEEEERRIEGDPDPPPGTAGTQESLE